MSPVQKHPKTDSIHWNGLHKDNFSPEENVNTCMYVICYNVIPLLGSYSKLPLQVSLYIEIHESLACKITAEYVGH